MVNKKEFLGSFLIYSGMFLMLFNFIGALPVFKLAMWSQSERAIILIYISSIIMLIGNITLLLSASQEVKNKIHQSIFHPFPIIFLLIALFSAITAIFQNVPIRSFYGSPELCEGVFLYLVLFITTSSAIFLSQQKRGKGFLLWSSVIAILIVLFSDYLYKSGIGWRITPYYFSDYIAFYAIFCSAIIITFGESLKKLKYPLALLILVLSLGVSNNNAAIALGLVWLPSFYLFSKWKLFKEKFNYFSIIIITMIPISLTLIVILVGLYFGSDTVLIESLPDSYKGHVITLLSRFYMIPIVFKAMLADPMSFVIGKGWASYGSQQIAFLPIDWLDIIGGSGPTWEGIWRHHFHSHNMFVDVLLALGIPGLILFMSLFILLPIFSKKEFKTDAVAFAGFYAALAVMWFQMPITQPFWAVAMAGFAKPSDDLNLKFKSLIDHFKKYIVYILALILVMKLYASYTTYDLAKRSFGFNPPAVETKSGCTDIFSDYGRGGLHLSKLIRGVSGNIMGHLPQIQEVLKEKNIDVSKAKPFNKIPDESFLKLKNLLCVADQYVASGNASLRLEFVILLTKSDIALSMLPYLDKGSAEVILDGWDEGIKRFITKTPNRTDQAAPYLLWQLNQNNDQEISKMTKFLLKLNKEDPVGLWFEGIVLLADPSSANKGLNMMKKALDNGIERIIPVDDNIKNLVMENVN